MNTNRMLKLTPQQANVVALEVTIAALERHTFEVPELDADSQRELHKAKSRLMERLKENLNYARKQAT